MTQISALKMMNEKYVVEDKKLSAAFTDLEKAYDSVERKGLWGVLRV